jgi:hypothetical protein
VHSLEMLSSCLIVAKDCALSFFDCSTDLPAPSPFRPYETYAYICCLVIVSRARSLYGAPRDLVLELRLMTVWSVICGHR